MPAAEGNTGPEPTRARQHCGQRFQDQERLNGHMELNHPPGQCNLCGKRFRTGRGLEIHRLLEEGYSETIGGGSRYWEDYMDDLSNIELEIRHQFQQKKRTQDPRQEAGEALRELAEELRKHAEKHR